MFKVFNVGPNFGNHDIFFFLNSYIYGNGVAIEVLLYPSCERVGCITVNIAEHPLPSPFAFLDVNNFPGILAFMCDNDFSTGAFSFVRSGFVDSPLVRLNLSRIKEFTYEQT